MGLVQNMAVSSPREMRGELVDGLCFRSIRLCDRIEDKVVCPMPRRVPSVHFSAAEPVKPFCLRRSLPSSNLDCDDNLELLEILRSKAQNFSQNAPNFGCSTPFFTGSPPSRSGNPIVHDAEFTQKIRVSSHHAKICSSRAAHGVECTSSKQECPQVKPRVVVSSAAPKLSPQVRVEGFDCSSYGFDPAKQSNRRHVAAFA